MKVTVFTLGFFALAACGDAAVEIGPAGANDRTALETPTLTGFTPNSPANDETPEVVGRAESGVGVSIFSDSTCETQLGTGVADGAGAFSIEISVTEDATTTVHAQARRGELSSPCSSGIEYVEDGTAPAAPAVSTVLPTSPANDNDPSVIGSAEAGSTVALFSDAACTIALGAGETSSGNTEFSVSLAVADDGTTTIFAQAADAAGNVSPCSTTSVEYVEDSTPPAVPTVDTTSPASPANLNDPLVAGTAETGSTVTLFSDSTCATALGVSGSTDEVGNYGLRVTVADNTTTAIFAQATDDAGNASGCSTTNVIYVEDSALPSVPVWSVATPPPANQNQPILAGNADAHATVRLFSDATCATEIASTKADGSGAFSFTPTVTDNSTTMFYARATNAAATNSACSQALTYVEDSLPPSVPTAGALSPAGPANENAPELTIAGEAGQMIAVFTDDTCSTGATGIVVENPAGTFTFTATVADDSTTIFYARATDTAGNASACSTTSATYVEDSQAPSPPTLAAASPASPSDDTSPVLTGTAESGSTVSVYNQRDCAGAVVATGSEADFAATGIDTAIAAENTTNEFSVTATDAAGNVSGCSNNLSYTHDALAPSIPTVGALNPAGPANNHSPELTIVGDAGQTVAVFTDDTCSIAATGDIFEAPAGTFTFTATVANDSTTTFYANATDEAGNTSACSSTSATFIEDSIAPTPVLTVYPSDGPITPGAPPSGTDNENNPTFEGTVEANAQVSLSTTSDCSGAPLATDTTTSDGTFSLSDTVTDNSTTTYYLGATDTAGNTACSPAYIYTEDSTAPNDPTVTGTTPASPSDARTPTVNGTVTAGDTVEVFIDSACTAGNFAGSSSDTSGGTYAVAVDVAPESTTTYYAQAVDAAGNRSGCIGSATYTHQTSLKIWATGHYYSGSSNDKPAVWRVSISTLNPSDAVVTETMYLPRSFDLKNAAAGGIYFDGTDKYVLTDAYNGISTYDEAGYWLNDATSATAPFGINSLPEQNVANLTVSRSITGFGGTVYVVGQDVTADAACFWENSGGSFSQTLLDGTGLSFPNAWDVAVTASDVIIVGTSGSAGYVWIDGARRQVTDDGHLYTVVSDGTDAYYGGEAGVEGLDGLGLPIDLGDYAAYFLDAGTTGSATEVVLDTSASGDNSALRGIALDGSGNVHGVGRIFNSSTFRNELGYWVDDGTVSTPTLPRSVRACPGLISEELTDVFFHDGWIYILGYYGYDFGVDENDPEFCTGSGASRPRGKPTLWVTDGTDIAEVDLGGDPQWNIRTSGLFVGTF